MLVPVVRPTKGPLAGEQFMGDDTKSIHIGRAGGPLPPPLFRGCIGGCLRMLERVRSRGGLGISGDPEVSNVPAAVQNQMFSGLMSRCTTSRASTATSASAMSASTDMASFVVSPLVSLR